MNKRKILRALAVTICVLAVWEIMSRVVNKSLFLPSPEKTLQCIVNMAQTGALVRHLSASFGRVTAGVCIAALIAVPLGFLISWNRTADAVLRPIVNSLHYIPITCFTPMTILLFGIGEKMKIILLVIAAAFSFLPSVVETASEDNAEMKETAYTMGFSYPRMLLHCQIPYIMPSLLESFMSLYGVGWTYVIIAESNNSQYGLGHLMYVSAARGRTEMVFASIIVIVSVSVIFDFAGMWVIKRMFRWKYKNEKPAAAKN